MIACLSCRKPTENIKFCSRRCSGRYSVAFLPPRPAKRQAGICRQCPGPTLPGNKFCSSSCAATFNNTGRTKVARQERSCRGCGCVFIAKSTSSKKYCTRPCAGRYAKVSDLEGRRTPRETSPRPVEARQIKAQQMATWIAGGVERRDCGISQRCVREQLLKDQKGCCSDCGFSQWEGSPIPLQLEHIDGFHSNEKRENLCLVCPNCHSLKPTSGARNKGRGRSWRKKHDRIKADAIKKAHKALIAGGEFHNQCQRG